MADRSVPIDQTLLAWIRQRAAETPENGSICLNLERGQITWVSYQGNRTLKPERHLWDGSTKCNASGR